MEPVRPDYLFSICGLTTKSVDEVKETILQSWKGQESRDFLNALQKAFPENQCHQAKATLQSFIDTLKVRMLDTKDPGNASAPTFNVYTQANLIPDDGLWCQLRNFYAAREYALPFQQPGSTSVNFFHCSICHSIDHPRGLCQFPTIEEWNGPTWRIPGTKRDNLDRNKNKTIRQKRPNWGDTYIE